MRAIELRVIRTVLAIIWIVTGILSLGIFPQRESLSLLEQVGLQGAAAFIALYGSASVDIFLGMLTLTYPSRMLWRVQATLVIAYTVIITFYLPWYWLHPFGPLLKNLPILLLLWLLHQHTRKAS